MKTSLSSAFCMLLFAFGLHAQNTAKLNIAVHDLKGKGLPQSTAEILSDRLRSELINTGVFQVMERNDMATILKEQGFQKTGACDEASCLVEVGQLLGVERMVAGSVGKIGNFYTISLRVINVATGAIIYTVNEDYEGSIKGVISTAIAGASLKLARGAGGEVQKAALSGKTGDLYIMSTPTNAAVTIDGKAVDGTTPLTLQGIAAGERRIVVRKNEYYGSKTLTLAPDDLLKVAIEMKKGQGALKVFSTPAGATVYLDGQSSGTTPCKVEKVTAGEHTVRIEKEGYLSYSGTAAIAIGTIQNLTVTLKPAAYISVSCGYANARVFINDTEVGRGNVQNYAIAAGDATVRVEAAGFDVWKNTLTLARGAHEELTAQLSSVFGVLGVGSVPGGAVVLLNEKEVGTTPYTNARLTPGNYMLKVQADSYEPVKTNVAIVKNTTVQKDFKLKHTTAYLDSVKRVTAVVKVRKQWARRIVFGVLAAGFGGAGVYYNREMADAVEDADALQAQYRTSSTGFDNYTTRYTEKREDAKVSSTVRNVFTGLAGACAVGFAISIPF